MNGSGDKGFPKKVIVSCASTAIVREGNSASAHTKGPWLTDAMPHGTGNYRVYGNDRKHIATIRYVRGDGIPLANARLIAKAPEMYEWIRDVLTGMVFAREPNHPAAIAGRALIATVENVT